MRWKTEQSVLDSRQERRVHNGCGVHPALFPTSTGVFAPKDEKRGSEPDHLPQSAAGVQNGRTYVTAPLIHLHSVVKVENSLLLPLHYVKKQLKNSKFSMQSHVNSFVHKCCSLSVIRLFV
jgi:hypothetical protein